MNRGLTEFQLSLTYRLEFSLPRNDNAFSYYLFPFLSPVLCVNSLQELNMLGRKTIF